MKDSSPDLHWASERRYMKNLTEEQAIRNLQRYLRQLSYEDPSIPSPPIDGILGEVTRASILAFQKNHALVQSGIADKETWDMLYAEYLASISALSAPYPLYLFPRVPEGYYLSAGDEYFLVSIIQLLLNELTIIYDSFIPLAVNGIYDNATEKNIRDFQSKNDIKVTGNTDKETWNKLVEAYRNYSFDYVR